MPPDLSLIQNPKDDFAGPPARLFLLSHRRFFFPFSDLERLAISIAAIVIGCNLPISLSLVWVSNPITIPPLFYAAYKTGAWILGQAPRDVDFELSREWLLNELGAVWEPFLLGCFVLGITFAIIGHIAVRIIWRIHVMSSWHERRRRREARSKMPPGM